jgi:hypothetical protein
MSTILAGSASEQIDQGSVFAPPSRKLRAREERFGKPLTPARDLDAETGPRAAKRDHGRVTRAREGLEQTLHAHQIGQ